MDRRAWRELVGVAGLVAQAEATLHWFPWPKVAGDELHPPTTYVVGMAPILAGYTAWSLRRCRMSGRDAVAGIGLITVMAGIAVWVCYVVDRWLGGLVVGEARGILWGRRDGGLSSGRS